MKSVHITLEDTSPPSNDVHWRVWHGITCDYELLAEGDAFTFAAATYQAGTFLQERTKVKG